MKRGALRMKSQVLEAIGEKDLNQPAQIGAALAANDRIKYYLSLLQSSVTHANHPEQTANSLQHERLACGIQNRALDDLVAKSQREGASGYRLPGCAAVLEQIALDLRVMAAPVLAAGNAQSSRAEFADRVDRALVALSRLPEDSIEGSFIDQLTRADGADGLHRLVMDLHKVLNGMQAALAEERLDGASVYQIDDADRPIVAAFMAGLNRTAPLKFNHPGLGTTATRIGERLVIQNDIGTTDAHVIVIHVEGNDVLMTHTDVHPERVQFLREMLTRYAVEWGEAESKQAESLASGLPFHMITGRFHARDSAELLAYLNFLAS